MGGGRRNRGGQKRGRTQRRHFGDGREDVWKKKPRDEEEAAPGWQPFVKESPSFEHYYKKQGIVPEDEWDKFLAVLRTSLPAAFRINASGKFATAIKDQIQQDFIESLQDEAEVDGDAVELIKPLSWYPEKLAWQLNFSRMQLRKNQTLARIHEFLKEENDIGSITRQEAVSMLPPLFLKVEPFHLVLDMCAAPGSKTFQLLEMIHKGSKKELVPDGLVIANDLDVQRCHLLVHQTKRMCSPNVIITNHEAQHFPGLRCDRDRVQNDQLSLSAGEQVSEGGIEGKALFFDRVLCDVPCSGDGTIRKAPDIWRKWNTGIGNGLHHLQVQIAMRGVALLKVGGRLVYSTCSLNPIEDEAVVGEILRRSRGCMELLDASHEFPELKHRPGLKTWKVKDKGRWFTSYNQVSKHRAGAIVSSMFSLGKGPDINVQSDEDIVYKNLESVPDEVGPEEPIDDTSTLNGSPKNTNVKQEFEDCEGEVAMLPLERCMRFLPHDQDTGGFFIAVFRKVSHLQVVQHMAKEFRQKQMDHPVNCRTEGEAASKSDSEDLEELQAMNPLLSQGEGLDDNALQYSDDIEHHIDEVGQVKLNAGLCSYEEINLCNSELLCLGTAETEVIAVRNMEAQQEPLEVVIKDKSSSLAINEKEANQNVKHRIQQQGKWKGVDPVLFLKDDTIINSLVDFYGIKETFPLHGHLVTRSDDTSHLKRIYYVSQSVRNVIQLNFRAGGQLKIASVGLKLFERQAGKEGFSPCAFRISSEGLSVVLPHVTRQIVYASRVDFRLLLSSNVVPFTAFHNAEFVRALQDLSPGCCIVIFQDKSDSKFTQDIDHVTAIGCWKGRTNLSLLVSKAEAVQLLERLELMKGDELHSFKLQGYMALKKLECKNGEQEC